MRRYSILLLVLLLALVAAGCSRSEGESEVVDFIAVFDTGRISPETTFATPTGKPALVIRRFPIGGERRDALVTLATGKIEFDIPAMPPEAVLTFAVGMNSDTGDGADGMVVIEADGQSETVYKKYLNPIDRPEDRKWFDETVDLTKYQGRRVKLTFTTGPHGNATADWFAWANPRLE
jgi:hypothetical protein